MRIFMGAMINGSLRGVFQESGIRQELSRFVTPQWPSGIFRLVVRETRTLCGRTAFSKGACPHNRLYIWHLQVPGINAGSAAQWYSF
jgi:hypothetical protein